MKITYHTHNVFHLEINGKKLLMDPFIRDNPTATMDIDAIDHLDYILLSHGHGDHLGDTVEIAQKTGAMVITNFELADYLADQGITTHPLHIGGGNIFDDIYIKLTPALHGSSVKIDGKLYDGGNPAGFYIHHGNKSLYFACDTALTMDMMLLKDKNIDIAVLPIGGNFTMDIDDAVKAVEFIKPKTTIPCHYNTFDLIAVNPEEFRKKNIHSKTVILEDGQSVEI